MFVKKWQLTFLFIGLMDWEARHLTIIVGTGGGAFASENCPQDRAFDQFLKMPGACPGGMLAAGINSHIIMYI